MADQRPPLTDPLGDFPTAAPHEPLWRAAAFDDVPDSQGALALGDGPLPDDDFYLGLDLLPLDDVERLLDESIQLSGLPANPEPEIDPRWAAALANIGLAPGDDLQLDRGDTPFYDQAAGAAFWFSVLQPFKDDAEHAMAGVLSVATDDEGQYQAAFAPCTLGTLDECRAAAARLIATAEQGGLAQAFDAAGALALETSQREGWSHDRGAPLPAAAQEVSGPVNDLELDF